MEGTMKSRFLIIIFSCILGLSLSNDLWAKYPDKKIRLIAAFAPGGGADIMARSLTKFVNPYLDGRIYVENIPGASGAIGFREAAKSAPDGYTLVMMVSTIMTGRHITKGYPSYDLFDPICVAAQDPTMISVRTDSRFKTIQELISFAKTNPGALTVATAGVGAIDHFYMSAFAKSIGVDFNFVPYKGAGPATVAAAGGHAEAVGSGYSEAFSLLTGKKLRPLLVFGNERSPMFPDVPTATEIGYDLNVVLFRAIGAPKGTSKDVKDILADAFKKAIANPEFQKMVKEMGLQPIFIGPDDAGAFLKKQDDFFTGIADKIGLKPQ
jgi:tripartite-type tricarboxylate transporter receptor subunit TctC